MQLCQAGTVKNDHEYNDVIDPALRGDLALTLRNLRTCIGAINTWSLNAGGRIPRNLHRTLLTALTLIGGEMARLENLLTQIDPRMDEAIADAKPHDGGE